MSRYYSIKISDPDSGKVIKAAGFEALDATYTSFYKGKTLPNAWNVEVDVYLPVFATPAASSLVRIWGISLKEISQASDLNGKDITVYLGMQKGLPLANPKQAKRVFSGVIYQAFGNWIGTDMTLDLIINPGIGTPQEPKNLIHNWKKGDKLADAIKTTITTAFKGYTVDCAISDKLVFTQDDNGYYETIEQFAEYIRSRSKTIISGDDYNGVEISLTEKEFKVFDVTTEKKPLEIAFQDLIGQPTWIESPAIMFKTVMRGDINVGDFIKLPQKGLVTATSSALTSQFNNKVEFQGTFWISSVRHVGNYRQPDAASWASIYTANPTKPVGPNG